MYSARCLRLWHPLRTGCSCVERRWLPCSLPKGRAIPRCAQNASQPRQRRARRSAGCNAASAESVRPLAVLRTLCSLVKGGRPFAVVRTLRGTLRRCEKWVRLAESSSLSVARAWVGPRRQVCWCGASCPSSGSWVGAAQGSDYSRHYGRADADRSHDWEHAQPGLIGQYVMVFPPNAHPNRHST